MDKQAIIEQVTPMLQGKFSIMSITEVNFKPHPYMIGPRHIQNNILHPEEIRRLEKTGVNCYHPKCTASYDEHTHDTGMFLKLTCNLTEEEAKPILTPVLELIESLGICGICFVDTPEKYRIS